MKRGLVGILLAVLTVCCMALWPGGGVAEADIYPPEGMGAMVESETSADPGDQSWFLCVDNRPYGVGQVYNDFMVSSTIAQCFVDYSYNPGLPSCPNLYDYQVWWTPAFGGWTGPHDIDGPYC